MTTSVDDRVQPPAVASNVRRAARRARHWRLNPFNLLGFGLAAVICVLIVYPIVQMIGTELFPDGSFNGDAFVKVWHDTLFRQAARNTVIITVVAGGIATLIGSLFAWFNERTDAAMGFLSRTLPLVPLLIPPICMSIGWVFLADPKAGFINTWIRKLLSLVGVHMIEGPIDIFSWFGLIFLYSIAFVPFVYILTSAALRNTDPALEEASRISGASPFTTFWRVSLPSIRPALTAWAMLLPILSVASFAYAGTVGYTARIPVISVYMVDLFQAFPPSRDEAAVVGLIVLVVMAASWLFQQRLQRRAGYAQIGGRAATHSRVNLGPMKHVARVLMLGFLAITSILPFLALLTVSLQPYWTPDIDVNRLTLDNFRTFVVDNQYDALALRNSLTLGAGGATIGVLVAAIMVAYARSQGGLINRFVDTAARLPGAFAHILIAVAFVVAFAGPPFRLGGTIWILLIVYVVMNTPQIWIAAGSAMDQVGDDLASASRLSGGSAGRTFFRITLPLLAPGLAAGWALLFVVMAGDLTASAILAGTNTPVVGFVLLAVYQDGTYSELSALGTVLTVITGFVVVTVLSLTRRSFRAYAGQ